MLLLVVPVLKQTKGLRTAACLVPQPRFTRATGAGRRRVAGRHGGIRTEAAGASRNARLRATYPYRYDCLGKCVPALEVGGLKFNNYQNISFVLHTVRPPTAFTPSTRRRGEPGERSEREEPPRTVEVDSIATGEAPRSLAAAFNLRLRCLSVH